MVFFATGGDVCVFKCVFVGGVWSGGTGVSNYIFVWRRNHHKGGEFILWSIPFWWRGVAIWVDYSVDFIRAVSKFDAEDLSL